MALLRWNMIILPILTTSLILFSLKGCENVLFELGSERDKQNSKLELNWKLWRTNSLTFVSIPEEDNEAFNRTFTCRIKCTLNHGGGFYKVRTNSGFSLTNSSNIYFALVYVPINSKLPLWRCRWPGFALQVPAVVEWETERNLDSTESWWCFLWLFVQQCTACLTMSVESVVLGFKQL